MCRMLFAAGKCNLNWLIQDMITIASDQNKAEKHENNRDQVFKHGDGWGIAYLENNLLKVFKSTKAIYEDRQIEQFTSIHSSFVVLHARKASRGLVDEKNVHPFEMELNGSRYLFFHNGTINEKLTFSRRFVPVGDTDSERLFYYLMTDNKVKIRSEFLEKKLQKIEKFTAANFILSDGKITHLANWYSENPEYYTLKVLQRPDFICVASEILPHFQNENWQRLGNKDILSVRTLDLCLENLKKNVDDKARICYI